MRRPQALDRRLAGGVFALAGIALLGTVGFASAPTPTRPLPAPDPVAARELVALMRAGERESWLVTSAFTRTLANGRKMSQTTREARNAKLHVLLAGPSMTIESPHRSYDCTLVGDRAGCSQGDSARTLPESEVLRVAVNAGAYGVTRLPGATIAGEPARCFRVLATGNGGLPDLGVETDLCLATDGISLRERVVHPTAVVDQREALSVERDVSTSDIEALARTFDPKAAKPRR